MIRKTLDGLYSISGAIAAGFLALICLLVSVQVIFNLITKLFGTTFALTIPSYAEFAGFFLAAASFLALAYTLMRGGHIRVTLILQFLPKRARLVFEVLGLAICAATAIYATYFMGRLTYESYSFGDLSPGIIAVPLWIPQTSLALGLGILAIALTDLTISTIIKRDLVLKPTDIE
ncbi:MAG: TRAP transporter small permease subunit [Devosiaceae bacterium]|nr:TRAP transporter small permease subunit [Devosiaceae bacterium]